jgi:SNF2 family DNA or RNA helicase
LLKIESNEEPEYKAAKLEIPILEPNKKVEHGNKTYTLKLQLMKSLEQSFHLKANESNKFSFHLGNHDFKIQFMKNKEKFEITNSQTNVYLYENTWRCEFLILLTNANESIWLQLKELNDFDKSVLYLTTTKYLYMVFNSINKLDKHLNIELYLTDKFKRSELTNDPSLCLQAKNVYHMNLLMTKFYFSLLENNQILKNDNHNHNNNHLNDQFTDSESKQTNENLFDMIYDLRESDDKQHDLNLEMEESQLIIQQSNLKPRLRPYQIKAVNWMLKKENFNFNQSNDNERMLVDSTIMDDNMHPLFVKIQDKNLESIYYHKYLGLFTTDFPKKFESEKGGILADEMGLGKTLEILACILINTRSVYPDLTDAKSILPNIKKSNEVSSFSCLCGKTPTNFKSAYFRSTSSSSSSTDQNNEINQCKICGTWTHVDCVNYTDEPESFICLKCTTLVPPVPSGATLIVTPSQISRQWIDEIEKHVNKKLKILYYTGCNQKYIQPKDLASLDICITTYDVLSAELAHVFAIENMHHLRKAKRFMNIPSPLINVEWWRICLDEAQMVHSTNSKCAEMASRLPAINRWCVTGTPIGRSLTDLHGLFTFIREDPYTEKKWFNEILYYPYMRNDKMPLVNAVSKVLWRTAKKYVEDQVS